MGKTATAVSLADLARMMVGTAPPDTSAPPGSAGAVRLQLEGIAATRDDGVQSVRDVSLAVSEGQKVIMEAKQQFPFLDACCVHRSGLLEIGDCAVWVGVSARHRDEAFKACRYIIDEIKIRLPIWKKEHYVDGDSGWVNCERCANVSHKS